MKFIDFMRSMSLTNYLNEAVLAQILGILFTTLFLHYFRQRIIRILNRVLGANYQLKACICFAVFMCCSIFLVYVIPDRPSQEAIEAQQKRTKEEAEFLEQLKWAEEGDSFFQDLVGYAYYKGRGVKMNYAKAVYWFRKSAEDGYCDGMYDLACMYYYGYGVDKDYKQAAYWYGKSYEKVPMPKAQYSLANMYLAGEGVEKNIDKALELYEAAANAKYSDASKKLGDIYLKLKRNNEKAVFWYSKAANDGKDREVMYLLGNAYYEGKIVGQDYKKAKEWYQKSIDLGYIPSMQKLADMYYYGHGVSQDWQKAFFWHKEVAGSAYFKISGRSMLIVGDMYSEGLGVEQNYQKALTYYRRAAAPTSSSTPEIQSQARAKLNRLEEQLEPGSNEMKAREGYTLANKFFAQGDYSKAVNLYELLAEQGHVGAKEKLDYIYSHRLARRRSSIMPSASQSAGDFNAVIAGNKVNIRTKPNTSSKVIKQLNAGHSVRVSQETNAKDGKWYLIETASGTKGWVFGKYVKSR